MNKQTHTRQMNIIFGVIIDTFAELRAIKDETDKVSLFARTNLIPPGCFFSNVDGFVP